MIHSVRSDQPGFKNVEFGPGFNVVLATRTMAATDKDSRNGAGKTTLVEIIHFCLGSSANKKKNRLMVPQLHGWTFTIELDLRGKKYSVSRNTASPQSVALEGDFSDWPIQPRKDKRLGQFVLPNSRWCEMLGWLAFGLPATGTGDAYEPTFRSLFGYFARRQRDAFSIPFEHYRKQMEWDKQVNTAFLLGLSWEYPSKLQRLKDQERTIRELRAAIKSGAFPDLLGTVGELESQKVRLEEVIARRGEQLRDFRVHPQYQEYQEQANLLQSAIRNLNQENATDRAMHSFYQESLADERSPGAESLAKLYKEAGVAWPGGVQKRLEDVQGFHEQLIVNRRAFLHTEISRLESALARRTEEVKRLSDERAALLQVLDTHGALAEYTALQGKQNEETAKLSAVNQRITDLRRIDEIKGQTRIEREQLQILARSFYDERKAERERDLSLFNQFSQALYDQAGKLIIDIVEGGYRFNVEIERQDSQGVEQMKVFCYDLTLATVWADRQAGPRFLIHDSAIFADVDERQKAHALELAADTAKKHNFQYICCLNSDTIPGEDFSEGFALKPYVRVELSDEGEAGGLLGIRY